MLRLAFLVPLLATLAVDVAVGADEDDTAFFEKRVRPLLAEHCYECHSEEAKSRQGGLLLDRRSGWMKGGDSGKSVVPGEPDASRLIQAVRYADEELQMPPDGKLDDRAIGVLEEWIRRGAAGPSTDPGSTEFSRLGDQDYLFDRAANHWAFQAVSAGEQPQASDPAWNGRPIDRFVFDRLQQNGLVPSPPAERRALLRRLSYDLTGLPPTPEDAARFAADAESDSAAAVRHEVDRLLASPAFGQHLARMWLDVVRYADTDSFYRPDTKTPHYFPFAFTYRDYVIEAFNSDKPYDDFVREQLAADLLEGNDPRRLAALGFFGVGPHANRNQAEAVDDWIDTTTRAFLGLTAACARCHDHKYEPIPTADYYALHGVFTSVQRVHPLQEEQLPLVPGYEPGETDRQDFKTKRAAIEEKIAKAGKKKGDAKKIRETELAELLLFHPAAPARAMIVRERKQPTEPVVFVRGDPRNKGQRVARRFLSVLDPERAPFPKDNSGRLQLAERIVDRQNPLTARVFVNRVWGYVTGSHLVDTPSDFGLQGSPPSHPELLDWLAQDFVDNGWSVKHLVRTIVLSRTYQQAGEYREDAAAIDPGNRLLWRAERRRLSIEELRDSLLAVSGELDHAHGGHATPLWGEEATNRRAIYGYVNRFNLDPTLRAFDFPSPMHSHSKRAESIVAPQALFTMNAPFVIERAVAITRRARFLEAETAPERIAALFEIILQRKPSSQEIERVQQFLELQQRFANDERKSEGAAAWPLVAQSLLMSNEFQYVD